MKKNNQRKLICFTAFFLVTIFLAGQVKISPAFYGSNYWRTDAANAPFGTIQSFTGTQWPSIRESGVVMMRQGGANYNRLPDLFMSDFAAPNFGQVTDYNINPAGYVKIVDEMRANSVEPMITVPFRDDGKEVFAPRRIRQQE